MNTAALLVVGIRALPGVYITEFVAPIDIFDHVRFHSKPLPGMKVLVVGPKREPLHTFEGVRSARITGWTTRQRSTCS